MRCWITSALALASPASSAACGRPAQPACCAAISCSRSITASVPHPPAPRQLPSTGRARLPLFVMAAVGEALDEIRRFDEQSRSHRLVLLRAGLPPFSNTAIIPLDHAVLASSIHLGRFHRFESFRQTVLLWLVRLEAAGPKLLLSIPRPSAPRIGRQPGQATKKERSSAAMTAKELILQDRRALWKKRRSPTPLPGIEAKGLDIFTKYAIL